MTRQTEYPEFVSAPAGRLLLKHCTPAVVSMLFMAFYQIADGILVGRRLGPDALASVNILYPVIALLSGLAVMIGTGGNTRIAVLLGESKTKEANRLLGLVTLFGGALGILLSLITLAGMPHVIRFLGNTGQMGVFATTYLQQLLPFFTPMILMFILSQAVRNDGQPGLASLVLVGAALLNILLDYLFLFVFDTGIAGAALATGLAQSLGAAVFALYFLLKTIRRHSGLRFGRPAIKSRWLQAIFLNGSFELLNSLAAGVTTFLFNRTILTHIGPLGVAAFTLVQYLLMLGMSFVMGIGNGAQPAISFNHGAANEARVHRLILLSIAAATVSGGLVFALLTWCTAPIAAIFLPGNQPAIILTGQIARYVRWAAVFMPAAMLGSIFLPQSSRPSVPCCWPYCEASCSRHCCWSFCRFGSETAVSG